MADQIRKGKLAVISGFSGAGKGTLVKELMKKHDNYVLSVSMTTRKPREGEVNGEHYFFATNEEFEAAIRDGALLEYAGYVDHYYGTPAAFVESQLEAGKNVLLEIEVQGAMQIKKLKPDTIMIFVITPGADELFRRLTGRGTDDRETVLKRLRQALVEAEEISKYDYILVNDDLEKSTDELDKIIQTQPDSYHYNSKMMQNFVRDLRCVIEDCQNR